jgi:hypothetical protein
MSKTPSDKLFQLIKSLSASEKRYFKIFIGGKTDQDSKYIQLFDAIDQANAFNDELLQTKIYKSQPSEGKKYPELKAYLYEHILKSLQSYDEQHSVDYRLNILLQSVSVLYKRGLYDNCLELMHKARRLATQYEDFGTLLDLIKWEKQIAYTRMDVDFLQKKLEHLHYEESQLLLKMQNLANYQQYFFMVYTTIKREALHRGDERMKKLHELVNHSLFTSVDEALSHRARVSYYRTLNLYYYAALEQEKFYDSGKTLIDLIESQPHFLKENIADYIASLSNLILSCGLLKKYDEVRICLEKLKNITPITEDDRRKIQRQYYTNKFVLCIFTGEFAEGKAEMEQHLENAAKLENQEQETSSFYFQYFCICFGNADYNQALDYLNEWLNQPRSFAREDLQSTARILSLILHYEMENIVLLESLLRSATRYLKSKNRLYDLERRFINFISDLIRKSNAKERKLVLQRMAEDLKKLAEQPAVRAALQTFDIEAWIEGKISGKSFAETVKLKAKNEI